jgi:hypothetical protein
MRTKTYLLLIPVLILALADTPHAQWPMTVADNLLVSEPYIPSTPGTAGIASYSIPYPNNQTLVIFWAGYIGPVFQMIDSYGYLVYDTPIHLCPDYPIIGSSVDSRSKPDGRGGVIHTWKNNVNPSFYRAQRIDSLANICWGDSALQIFNFVSTSRDFCPDGQNGWFFVMLDEIGSLDVIKLQHVSPEGQLLFPDSGLVVYSTEYALASPKIAPDDNGGFYVVWRDDRPPYTSQGALYRQHYDSEYHPTWDPSGILVAPNMFYNQVLPDGQGGLILYSGGEWQDVYRFGRDGSLLWVLDQIGGCYQHTKIVAGEPGFFYIGMKHGIEAVYGQRIDIEGNVYWPTSGPGTGAIMGYSNDYDLWYPIDFAYRDPYFYAVFLFRYTYSLPPPDYSYDLYVQSLDQDGNRRFGEVGTMIAQHIDTNAVEPRMTIAPDALHGAVAVWDLDRVGGYHDILAKHVNSDGQLGGPVWTEPSPQRNLSGTASFTIGLTDNRIRFELPIAGEVGIRLYDLMGKLIYQETLPGLLPGVHTFSLNTQNLSSGIYFAKLTSPVGCQALKVPIIR